MDSISDRIHSSLTLKADKSDSKTALTGIGSPVSPLHALPAASSSSSSSGSVGKSQTCISNKRSDSNTEKRSHSGELSGGCSPTATPKPVHRRTGSNPLIFSGSAARNPTTSSTASSPVTNALPAGNICPSGKIVKTGLVARTARTDVLGTGTGNYGHGSIMRSGTVGKSNVDPPRSNDVQEITRRGNECYKKGLFVEAMKYYDRAVEICPANAACRNNRAAALVCLGRLDEASKECQEAVTLDPDYGRAHHRLATLYLRFGEIEDAKKHIRLSGQQSDNDELQRLQSIERHIGRCFESRKVGD